MRRPVDRGFVGRVQRKSKKSESANAGQGLDRLSLRGHPTAKGFAASNERDLGNQLCCGGNGGAHGGMAERRGVGSFLASLHVRELVTQRGYVASRQVLRDRRH